MTRTQPDETPTLAHTLAQKWKELDDEEGDRPHAVEGTRIRHSWAAKCSRAMWYRIMGYEPSEGLDLAAHWTFGIGRKLHEEFQQALTDRFADDPGVKVEHEVEIHIPRVDSSGHVDTEITELDPEPDSPNGHFLTSIEIKTINGWGYKKAVGGLKYPADGPRWSAVVQGAINASASEADQMMIIYLPLESISKGQAERYGLDESLRHGAQWTYSPSEFNKIADDELDRWAWILKCAEEERMPPRWIPDPYLPDRSMVTDPSTGATVNPEGATAKTWMCDYCEFQTRCKGDP